MGPMNYQNLFFLWIGISLVSEKYVKGMPPEDFIAAFKDIGQMHVACQCGKSEKIREKDVDLKSAQKLFWKVTKDKDFLENLKKFSELFKEFVDCSHCNLTYENCSEDPCVKNVIKFSLKDIQTEDKEFEKLFRLKILTMDHAVNQSNTDEEIPADYIPQVIEIPIGGHKNHSRLPRFVGCSYPTAMETAAISCRVYPSSIKCVEKCAFGYTLDSGIQKNMQCNFKDNRWIPSGFKECLPFVDCSVTLSSGGSATCSTSSIDKAPVCKIECLHYEDKPAVPAALYACNIDGIWEPPLPFCAMPGSGLVLAPAPRIKMESD